MISSCKLQLVCCKLGEMDTCFVKDSHSFSSLSFAKANLPNCVKKDAKQAPVTGFWACGAQEQPQQQME